MASNHAASVSPAAKQIDRPFRPSRPNYKQIHALPLPINIFPLPPLIPHNPLSIFQVALTYLFQLVAPSSFHAQPSYQACLSLETCSVHVTDEATVRVLWERGFFGKGSLSRSEPSWLDREKRRKGVNATETSEEVTRRRREERRIFKKERARKEREALEEKLQEEAGHAALNGTVNGTNNQIQDAVISSKLLNGLIGQSSPPALDAQSEEPAIIESSPLDHGKRDSAEENGVPKSPNQLQNSSLNDRPMSNTVNNIVNQEHLQLTPEEAFFLVYGLGILQIKYPKNPNLISTASLFSLFRQISHFPQQPASDIHPDDPFLLSYVVYHHFRSLGWVVRPGIKFAVDYLLYNRGPVFAHAEFAVLILPSYSHAYWHSGAHQLAKQQQQRRSWTWLHCVNRVQSQVRKSLLLVYVEVPPPMGVSSPGTESSTQEGTLLAESDVDITRLLQRYRIRELTVRRWTPNRSRD